MSATHNHLRQEEESRRGTAYSADLARRNARRSLWLSGAAIALIAVDLLVHL